MDEKVIKTGIKNSIILGIAQLIGFLAGLAKVLILPLILEGSNFGYWSVYLFYLLYVGVLAFGYNDGIYLRYGRFQYEDLPKPLFRATNRLFIAFQLLVTLITILLVLFESDPNKQVALMWVAFNIPITGLTGVFSYIFQVTNQIKKYSLFTLIDKIIVLVAILIVFLLKYDNFVLLIAIDTFSKVIVLCILIYTCRDLLFGKGVPFREAIFEFNQNVTVGIKLLLANLSGMLILGSGRFIVDLFGEDKVTFGIFSLANSSASMVMMFISAMALVIYPTFKRLNEENYPKYMLQLNEIIVLIVFGVMLAYFPLYFYVDHYLVNYRSMFDYLPFVFITIFVQAKLQVIINPFYTLLREEKAMLRANVAGLLIVLACIVPSYYFFKSITLITIGTFVGMAIRVYFSEIYLKKKLGLTNFSNILFELGWLAAFLAITYLLNFIIGFIVYLAMYIGYLVMKRSQLMRLKNLVRPSQG